MPQSRDVFLSPCGGLFGSGGVSGARPMLGSAFWGLVFWKSSKKGVAALALGYSLPRGQLLEVFPELGFLWLTSGLRP